jgi:hypothetical protein
MVSRSTSELMNLVDENDVETARKFFHPEYMYVRELEMLGVGEVMSNLEEFASGVCSSTNRVTLFDDDRTNVFSHDVTYNERVIVKSGV